MVLVITGAKDVTADLVCRRFSKRGIEFFRLNTDTYPSKVQVSLAYSKDRFIGRIYSRNRSYEFSEFDTVWFRKPVPPQISNRVRLPKAREFALEEASALLSGLYRVLVSCHWVSRPDAIRRGNDKLLQLVTARDLGLRTPATLITTNPQEAKKFCREIGEALVKPLRKGMIEYAKRVELIFSSKVTKEDLENLQTVRFAPCLFQEYVPKQFEVRVTVIGRKVFAVRLNTQENDVSRIDWRRDNSRGVSYEPHTLPRSIEHKLLKFMRLFGLHFSAFDLIVTPDGGYVFLENNPNGQWAWLDFELNNGMVDYMARYLSEKDSRGAD